MRNTIYICDRCRKRVTKGPDPDPADGLAVTKVNRGEAMNCSMGHEHRARIDGLICDEATKAQKTVATLHARHDRYKAALESFALGAHFHEDSDIRPFSPRECPGCVSQQMLDADRKEDEKRESEQR